MNNEILLLGSVLLIYGAVILAYRLFGKIGLYTMTVIATILANIEVLILIDAFGMKQTLGNVMFASTYLITDILSENHGKKDAQKAVWIGVFTSCAMVILTQYWLLYTPSADDWARENIFNIFKTTPRLIFASFIGYIISQQFDVWMYHKWWDLTKKITGNNKSFLWFRNNAATLISQMINTVLFTVIAFAGWYETKTLISVMFSSYVIYIFTSLLDTPFVYFARFMNDKKIIEK